MPLNTHESYFAISRSENRKIVLPPLPGGRTSQETFGQGYYLSFKLLASLNLGGKGNLNPESLSYLIS